WPAGRCERAGCFLSGRSLAQAHDRRSPAALAVAAEPVALDRVVAVEQAVDGSSQHALALAVDDPQIANAPRAADLDVLADQRGDLLGPEIVEVELAVDRELGRLGPGCQRAGPWKPWMPGRPAVGERRRSGQRALVAAEPSLDATERGRDSTDQPDHPQRATPAVAAPAPVDQHLELAQRSLAASALDHPKLTEQRRGHEVEGQLARLVALLVVGPLERLDPAGEFQPHGLLVDPDRDGLSAVDRQHQQILALAHGHRLAAQLGERVESGAQLDHRSCSRAASRSAAT